MLENTQGSGTGVTGIWDLIVLVIIARMFGFGDMNGQPNNATTAAATEAQIERAIRASQDTADNRASQAAILQKQNDIGATITAGNCAIIANQTKLADDAQIRDLSQRLTVAENALNNCNQTAAFTAAINSAVNPLAQAVASIIAQLNCGVKSIPYTASVPAYLPPVTTMPQFPYAS